MWIFPVNFEINYIRAERKPRGATSFISNLRTAIPHIRGDKVLFIEDDDYYKPEYIEQTVKRLDMGADIVGQWKMIYWHWDHRIWRLRNNWIAPLSATGIRWPKCMPHFMVTLDYSHATNSFFVDSLLWRNTRKMRQWLYMDAWYVVGMKGMPGRPNLTSGQEWAVQSTMIHRDPNLFFLQQWIGDDVEVYKRLWEKQK